MAFYNERLREIRILKQLTQQTRVTKYSGRDGNATTHITLIQIPDCALPALVVNIGTANNANVVAKVMPQDSHTVPHRLIGQLTNAGAIVKINYLCQTHEQLTGSNIKKNKYIRRQYKKAGKNLTYVKGKKSFYMI